MKGDGEVRKIASKTRCGLWFSLLGTMTACAAADFGAWQVPGDWEVRVTEQGAVREWTGKTWCGHVQGMCVSSNALYFAFHNQIVKTDWYGRLLKRADNLVRHTGDICHWNGRLYTIICHAKPVEGVPGSPASIQVFDEDLNIVKTKTFTRIKGEGGDGITCLDGVLYVGMAGYCLPGETPEQRHCARFRKFDATTLEEIGNGPFVVDFHAPIGVYGQQNITTDGTYIYVDSDAPDEDGDTFFKFDRDFKLLGKYNFGWKQGVDVVPGGKDGAVRFIYCSTPNWLKFREEPTLSVHALILFAELKGDNIRDITRHCVFKNPLPR